MPVKPLPKKLIGRLTKASAKIEKSLGRMKNIDSRRNSAYRRLINFGLKPNPKNTKEWGGRVRQMNVSRNFFGTDLIIKRVQDAPVKKLVESTTRIRFLTAQKTIDVIKKKIEKYNKKYKSKTTDVIMPDAHAINNKLIAMQKIDGVTSITGNSPEKKFFRQLLKKNNISKTKYYLEKRKVCFRSGIPFDQLAFVGIKKGKLVFMPLMDLI